MGFEEDVEEADKRIQAEYPNQAASEESAVREYAPIFERLRKEAIESMGSRNISELRLGIMCVKLHFKRDGIFYLTEQDLTTKLESIEELPRLYQDEADYIEELTDRETHKVIGYHEAMRDALKDFEQTIKRSLEILV